MATAATLAAQQTQAPATFRVAVDLVTVDVRVLDKAGRPIPGLTADDFVVTLDGKPSPVRLVDFLEFPTRPPGTAGAPMSATAAAPATPVPGAVRPGRSVVFGVDARSIRIEDMPSYVQIISRAIGLLGDDDIAALVVPGGGQSVAATRDRTPLLRAVRTLTGRRMLPYVPVYVGVEESRMYQSSRNEGRVNVVVQRECGGVAPDSPEAQECTQTVRTELFAHGSNYEREVDLQIDALYDMIEAARKLPPPRILVLCSNGAALGDDKFSKVTPIAEMALRADVQIEYLTQPPPNLDSASQMRTQYARSAAAPSLMFLRDEDEKYLRRGGDNIAEMLGAPIHRFMIGTDPALENLLIGWSGSYRLGMQPPDNAGLSKLVPLKVGVTRPGATVLANRQALIAGNAAPDSSTANRSGPGAVAPPPPTPESRLADALAAGGESAVPMRVGTAMRRDEAGRDVQIVTVAVPRGVPEPITAQFGVLDETGKIVQRGSPSLSATADGGFRSVFSLALAPGKYRLRAAAIDADGKLGVAELTVDVVPRVVGPVAASDLFIGYKDDDGRMVLQTTDLIPGNADSVAASIEFYAAVRTGTTVLPQVHITLSDGGGSRTLGDWTPQPRLTMQGAQVAVPLPWDTMAAGQYTITAVISVGAAPPLTLVRTITKGS